MKLFEVLFRSVMRYEAEIWRWNEREEVEKVQQKYLRWCLKVDGTTPTHVIRKETRVEKISIKAAARPVNFEEKLSRLEGVEKLVCADITPGK